jgi:hypothetical protein
MVSGFIINDKVQLVNESLLVHEKSHMLKANVAIEHGTCNSMHMITNIIVIKEDFLMIFL